MPRVSCRDCRQVRDQSGDTHLLVLRGFEERILLWAADHLVEGGAGRDHGVNAVFFFYGEVDEEWFAAGAGFRGCRSDFGSFCDVGGGDAGRGGKHDEGGGGEGGGGGG